MFVIAGFVLNGTSMFLLARRLTGSCWRGDSSPASRSRSSPSSSARRRLHLHYVHVWVFVLLVVAPARAVRASRSAQRHCSPVLPRCSPSHGRHTSPSSASRCTCRSSLATPLRVLRGALSARGWSVTQSSAGVVLAYVRRVRARRPLGSRRPFGATPDQRRLRLQLAPAQSSCCPTPTIRFLGDDARCRTLARDTPGAVGLALTGLRWLVAAGSRRRGALGDSSASASTRATARGRLDLRSRSHSPGHS